MVSRQEHAKPGHKKFDRTTSQRRHCFDGDAEETDREDMSTSSFILIFAFKLIESLSTSYYQTKGPLPGY